MNKEEKNSQKRTALTDKWLPRPRGCWEGMAIKRAHEGIRRGVGVCDRTRLYPGCGGGYTTLCVFQNSQNCTPQKMSFTVCKQENK